MKRLVAAALAGGLLCAGCGAKTVGGSGRTSNATGAAPATATSAPATSSQTVPAPDLKPQLLSVSDLPTGWAVDHSADNSSGEPPCLRNLSAITNTPDHADASFVQDGNLPWLSQGVGFYGSTETAQAKFAAAAAVLNTCTNISFKSDGTKVTGTIGEMSFPSFGDQSKTWNFALSGDGVSVGIDVVLVNKGAELEVVALGDLGSVSTDDLEGFCRQAVAKMP